MDRYGKPFTVGSTTVRKCVECSTRATQVAVPIELIEDHDATHES